MAVSTAVPRANTPAGMMLSANTVADTCTSAAAGSAAHARASDVPALSLTRVAAPVVRNDWPGPAHWPHPAGTPAAAPSSKCSASSGTASVTGAVARTLKPSINAVPAYEAGRLNPTWPPPAIAASRTSRAAVGSVAQVPSDAR